MKNLPAWIVLLTLLSTGQWARADDTDFEDVPARAGWGNKALKSAAVIGAIGLVASQDQRLQSKIPHFFSNGFGRIDPHDFGKRGTALERFGRMPGAGQLAGGFYLGGVITGSVNARKVGVLALEAKVANDIVTRGLKMAVGRKRPGPSSSDGDEFKPFGKTDSFPSGHTSTAFALATVVAENHKQPWVKFASYGVAGMVGVSRINQGAHWASDVAGGAVVGILVGKFISRFERRKGWSKAIYFGGDNIGIKKKFGGSE